MADVAGALDRENADRGQLILITGLAVALSIVVLVLLLNTVIYTENLATRTVDGSSTEAIEYQQDVRRGVGGIVDHENAREHEQGDDVEANVTDGIGEYDRRLHRQHAEHGVVASTSVTDTTRGALVRHNDSSREFESASGSSDWTVASGLPNDRGTRAFTMTVDQSDLEAEPDAFYVEVNASQSERWRAYVYRFDSEVQIKVEADGSNEQLDCAAGQAATIDFTRGTVDGERCPGLNWGESVDSNYDLKFGNGNNAMGTYNVTVNTDDGSIGDVNDDVADGSPYYVPAVYDVTADVVYETPQLTYEAELRVAPGEAE